MRELAEEEIEDLLVNTQSVSLGTCHVCSFSVTMWDELYGTWGPSSKEMMLCTEYVLMEEWQFLLKLKRDYIMSNANYKNMSNFILESNAIEGIFRDPTEREVQSSLDFVLYSGIITVGDVENMVNIYTNYHGPFRSKVGMDVRVADHIPPPGGPDIRPALEEILERVNDPDACPWETHILYETLHPFMDGNGRSGRILWARQMYHGWQFRNWRMTKEFPPVTFLQQFYYQTLSNVRRK